MYAIEPIGVVFPRDPDDVCAVVSTAAQLGVPVLPRGAGTSLAGQTVGHAVVIDLSRQMHDITALDAERRVATVQPGVAQEQLNRRAAADGLIFGPDTSTRNRAAIGGMIGNNSSGSHSIRYGCTADHVLELDVVLSDGSRAHLAPVSQPERDRRAGAATLEGRLYAELPALLRRHGDAIATGYPSSWRQSGGYRLDRLAAAPEFDLSKRECPARCRHGHPQERVPRQLPGDARRPAAIPAIRLDPRREPGRLGPGTAVEPAGKLPAGPPPA
jgi:hypothetical protein